MLQVPGGGGGAAGHAGAAARLVHASTQGEEMPECYVLDISDISKYLNMFPLSSSSWPRVLSTGAGSLTTCSTGPGTSGPTSPARRGTPAMSTTGQLGDRSPVKVATEHNAI